MSSATNDNLWPEESLISENCLCQLVMKANGNLLLYDTQRVYKREFISVWMSNSQMFNYSDGSEPQFSIQKDGTLEINEILWRNTIPSFQNRYILLWKSNKTSLYHDFENMEAVEYILYLSDDCCLLIEAVTKSIDNAVIWNVCATPSPTHSTTLRSTTVTDKGEEEESMEANTLQNGEDLWWIWLIILLLILISFCIYYRYSSWKQTKWIGPSTGSKDNTEYEESEGEHGENEQIKQWRKETDFGSSDDGVRAKQEDESSSHSPGTWRTNDDLRHETQSELKYTKAKSLSSVDDNVEMQ